MTNPYQLESYKSISLVHMIRQRCEKELIFKDNFKIITSCDLFNATCKLDKVVIKNIDKKNNTSPMESMFDIGLVRDLEFRFTKDVANQNICQAVMVTKGEFTGQSKYKSSDEDKKVNIKIEKEDIIDTYYLDINAYNTYENEPTYPTFQQWLDNIHFTKWIQNK